MSKEDDTYSTIFTALKHPIRRNILRQLSVSPTSYTELLNSLGIENGLLNYHLDSMRELIKKSEDGTYNLSEFGRAGLNLIQKVEEPAVKTSDKRRMMVVGAISALLFISLVAGIGFLYTENNGLKILADTRMTHITQLQTEQEKTNEMLNQTTLILNDLKSNYANLLLSNFTPPISKQEALGIALSRYSVNPSSLKGVEFSVKLGYMRYFQAYNGGMGWEWIREVNEPVSDYSPKVEYNVSSPIDPSVKATIWYKYIWVVNKQPMPIPGKNVLVSAHDNSYVDASTGDLFAYDDPNWDM